MVKPISRKELSEIFYELMYNRATRSHVTKRFFKLTETDAGLKSFSFKDFDILIEKTFHPENAYEEEKKEEIVTLPAYVVGQLPKEENDLWRFWMICKAMYDSRWDRKGTNLHKPVEEINRFLKEQIDKKAEASQKTDGEKNLLRLLVSHFNVHEIRQFTPS